jgi:hypothetical protein
MCTAVGCKAAFSIHIPLSAADITDGGIVIEVCRETECLSGSIYVSDAGVTTTATASFPNGANIEATKSSHVDVSLVEATSADARLNIDWYPYYPDQLRNGDHYRVNVTTPAGAAVFSMDTSTDYVESMPNGPGCGPVCHSVEVTIDPGSN